MVSRISNNCCFIHNSFASSSLFLYGPLPVARAQSAGKRYQGERVSLFRLSPTSLWKKKREAEATVSEDRHHLPVASKRAIITVINTILYHPTFSRPFSFWVVFQAPPITTNNDRLACRTVIHSHVQWLSLLYGRLVEIEHCMFSRS